MLQFKMQGSVVRFFDGAHLENRDINERAVVGVLWLWKHGEGYFYTNKRRILSECRNVIHTGIIDLTADQ